jgi:hypothetical protein
MIGRRAVIVGVIVPTGIVTTGSSVAASAGLGSPTSAELVSAKNTRPLTKAQFITQANALCDAARTAFVPVSQQFAGIRTNPTPQAIAAFAKVLGP